MSKEWADLCAYSKGYWDAVKCGECWGCATAELEEPFPSSPANCSNAGHDCEFRTGAWDGCHTCGVEW